MANRESKNPGEARNGPRSPSHTVADEMRVLEHLDQRLSQEETREAEAHLANCRVCQDLREAWQRLDTEMARGLERPKLSADFAHRLFRRLGPAAATHGQPNLLLQKAEAEKELQERWSRMRRRFLRANLPAMADGLGYGAAAAVAGYYLVTFGPRALLLAAKALAGHGQNLGLNAALVLGLTIGLTCLAFTGRKQVQRLWAAL